MTAGKMAAGRSSTAARTNVCEPPPPRPGHADPLGIDIREARQEVEGADAVERLQAEERLLAEFGVGVGEAGAVLERLGVGVADHVVVEDDKAHAGELRGERLERVAGALHRLLGPDLHLLPRGRFGGLEEAAPLRAFRRPVAVRIEHGRILAPFARLGRRPVQVAGDVVARQAGEEHLLDGVAVALDLAVDGRLDRRPLRHGPQAGGDQHLLAQRGRRLAHASFVAGGANGK